MKVFFKRFNINNDYFKRKNITFSINQILEIKLKKSYEAAAG